MSNEKLEKWEVEDSSHLKDFNTDEKVEPTIENSFDIFNKNECVINTDESINLREINTNPIFSWSKVNLKIETAIIISIENEVVQKIPIPQVDTTTLDDYAKQNIELKKINEILEREINLLKSLILINNLNLNTHDFKPCKI